MRIAKDLLRSRAGSAALAVALALGVAAAAWLRLAGPGPASVARAGEPIAVEVAGEALSVPPALIRFADQRRPGRHARLDFVLAWPGLGAPGAHAARGLDDTAPDPTLVFLSIEPREGALDSSTRLATVYGRFFAGEPFDGPAGLVGRRMAPGSGYEDEIVFFEPGSVRPFAARCFAAEAAGRASLCLREIAIGRDLAATYRFRYGLIGEWRALDERVRALAEGFLGG